MSMITPDLYRPSRRHRAASWLLGSVLVISGCGWTRSEARILGVLKVQANAWNRGDVTAFMDHYWRSPELTFSSDGHTLHGWDATLERFRRRYPDRAAMGSLRFGDLQITRLAPDAALVLGRWHLAREAGDVGGSFSLVLQRIAGRWLIRHDHTSRDATDAAGHGGTDADRVAK